MKVAIIFLFLIISTLTFAQKETKKPSTGNDNVGKNAIYVSAGSIFIYSSVSLDYELRIGHSDSGFLKNYYLNLKAGFFNENSGFAPGPNSKGVVAGLGVIGLTGTGDNHFEVGLGFTVNIENEITNNEPPEDIFEEQTFVLPDIALGYRSQIKNGPIFRAGIGFPRLVYLGLGYSF